MLAVGGEAYKSIPRMDSISPFLRSACRSYLSEGEKERRIHGFEL